MKNIDELHALWQGELAELTIPIMNRVIALYPQVQNDTACPVTWTKDGENFKALLPVMGTDAWFIIDPNGVILHSNRRWPQYYLPANIQAAIMELCPTWSPGNVAFSSPIADIRQIVDTNGQPFGNWFSNGVGVIYQITFDNAVYTSDAFKNTYAYNHPTVNVNQYGVIQ